jgi:hypothetical protein
MTSMKRVRLASVCGVAVCAAAFALAVTPSTSGAAGASCHRAGWARVAENRYVVVFKRTGRFGDYAYACDKASGKRISLVESDDINEDHFVAVAVAGHSVGWALTDPNIDVEGRGRSTYIHSARFYLPGQHPRWRGWIPGSPVTPPGKQPSSRVGSVAVRPNATVAWIACPPRRTSGSRGCAQPGFADTIHVKKFNSRDRAVVAQGTRIDPRSLRRHDDRLVWTQRRKARSAPFST